VSTRFISARQHIMQTAQHYVLSPVRLSQGWISQHEAKLSLG